MEGSFFLALLKQLKRIKIVRNHENETEKRRKSHSKIYKKRENETKI